MIALFAEKQVAISSERLGESMVTGGLVHEHEFGITSVRKV